MGITFASKNRTRSAKSRSSTTKLWLTFNGADGSVPVDSSPSAKTITASGGATISNNKGLYAKVINCHHSCSPIAFGAENLTVRFNINPTANNSSYQNCFNNGWGIQVTITGTGKLYVGLSNDGSSNFLVTNSTSLFDVPLNTDTEVSIERHNNVLYLYKNRVRLGTSYPVSDEIYSAGNCYAGGFPGTNSSVIGTMDNLIVKVGEAMAGGAASY